MKTSPTTRKRFPFLLFVLAVTLPFSYNCIKTPLDPVVPKWETQLNLTLVNKVFYFSDMVAKDSKFDTTTGVILYKPIQENLGSRQGLPPDVFKMPSPKGNIITQEIGVIPVDIGVPPTFSLSAADLGINSSNLNPTFDPQTAELSASSLGMPTGIPLPADFASLPVNQEFGDTSKFVYLVFANGTMSLKITNSFPFAIKFAGDSIRLLNNNSPSDTNEVVAKFVFAGQINAGTTMTSTPVALANVKMNGKLKLKGTMGTIGATGNTLNSNHKLGVEVAITNPQIQSMFPDPAPPVALNQEFGDSTNFRFIIFDNGQMVLTINNSFPFDIQFAGNSMQLVNKLDTTEVVGTFTFPGTIAANTTVTSNTVQLSGKKMDAVMKLKGTVNISNYFGKTISGTDKIISTLSLSNGYLQSASISTLNFQTTSVLDVPDSAVLLDDEIKIKLAKFDSGAVRIRIVNNAALKLSVKFGISELRDNANGGVEFRLNGADPTTGIVTIDAKDSLVQVIPMKNVTFVSRDRSGSDTVVTQNLHFSLEIKTLQASSGYITVNKTDDVIAEVAPQGSFVLSEVQGKIPPRSIEINQSFDIGIGDISENLTLKGLKSSINLSINALSTGLFPTDVDMYVVPVNANGVFADSVHITKRINPGDPSIIPIDTAAVNKLTNSFMATTGQLPSKFIVRGAVTISPADVYNDNTNPKAGVGVVRPSDSVFINMDYAIPVAIGIKDGLLKSPPTEFANTIEDTSQIGLIKNGKIYLDFTNTFPLDVELKIRLLKGMAADKSIIDTISPPVLTIPQNPADSVNYPPLRVEADESVLRTGKRSFTFLNLTPDDAKKLGDASFSAVDILMKTSGNGDVAKQFFVTDKLTMSVKANIIFLIDTEKMK